MTPAPTYGILDLSPQGGDNSTETGIQMDIYVGYDADYNVITRPATPAEVAAINAAIDAG